MDGWDYFCLKKFFSLVSSMIFSLWDSRHELKTLLAPFRVRTKKKYIDRLCITNDLILMHWNGRKGTPMYILLFIISRDSNSLILFTLNIIFTCETQFIPACIDVWKKKKLLIPNIFWYITCTSKLCYSFSQHNGSVILHLKNHPLITDSFSRISSCLNMALGNVIFVLHHVHSLHV